MEHRKTTILPLAEKISVADTQTSEFLPTQKLYRTALNYLDRLQRNHDELSEIIGAKFTNVATRAIVFNGISVSYQNNEPYSFDWTGLRIDASAVVNYYHRFNSNIDYELKEFMHLFGLEASLNESSIFEEDYQIEAMSTVKGLRLINQGQIPNTQTKKITMANISEIDTLQISDNLKTKYRDSVRQGNTIYTPTKQYTYQNWTGLVYVSINPNTGFGSYVIGEGLNGGYTVEQWPDGWSHFWRQYLVSNLTAVIISPVNDQTFVQGGIIKWQAHYDGEILSVYPVFWDDNVDLNTTNWKIGTHTLKSGYGTSKSVGVVISSKPAIGTIHNEYDDIILTKANKYGIPVGILKAIIHKETENNLFSPNTSRYEPKRDFTDFSGYDAGLGYPAKNINTTPFSYYELPGINTRGQIIEEGPRINSLKRDYKTTLKNIGNGGWQLRGIITTDRDGGGILTVEELYVNDSDIGHGTQNWPEFGIYWVGDKYYTYTGNFTPQFLISSSYGLGHVMYLEATEALDPQSSKIMKDNHTPHDIIDNNDLGIELMASILKGKFGDVVPNDNCAGWSAAVFGYNPSIAYQEDVCGLYASKYK